jgi:hypothetical protein
MSELDDDETDLPECEHRRMRQIGPDDFQCTDCGEVFE